MKGEGRRRKNGGKEGTRRREWKVTGKGGKRGKKKKEEKRE